MQTNWDLSIFYKGFDDPAFPADMASAKKMIAEASAALAAEGDAHEKIVSAVRATDTLSTTLERLNLMVFLTLAVESENEAANAAMTPLRVMMVEAEKLSNAFSRYLAGIENLDALVDADPELAAIRFSLLERAENARHQLPAELEAPILRMQLSGGQVFSHLHDQLTATLEVDFRGEKIPLSAVRGKAYDPDASVRRDAYDAELAAYAKIELPMAACLNSIKAEGQTIAELKGYKTILEMTLAQSRMQRRTLDSMWQAVSEALPELRLYLKAKAKLIGYPNGLPFYELFAPVGESSRRYTVEEARELLLGLFGQFCPEMGDMMREAFDEGWIDMYPRAGKSGGAFCAGCYAKDVSRVMTNFSGSLSDVSTLAHELGHAFNDRMLTRVPRALTDIPMQLAETASTFNETVLAGAMRQSASAKDELTLLDADLMESFQVLVDIYSRYLFETRVVEAQADHALSVRELKEAMLWAQDQSYGDGLDPELRHPYMWACKSHYYGTDIHFYNFPYAFGFLFARGLYARYQAEGASFVPVYCDLLSRFGSDTIENITASVGIDVTTPDFWRSAVAGVVEEAKRFAELANQFVQKE